MTDFLTLPPGLETWTALLLVVASSVTSFITAAFGIGGGTVLLAIMAILVPPAALIPVHGLVQLGSNGGRLLLMLKQVERSILWPFIIGSVLGVGLGGLLFIQLPTWLVQFAIAGFIIWSVLGTLPTIGNHHVFAAGAFSSFLTMFFGATGTFVSALVKSLNLAPVHYVATHAALMTLQHLLKIITFGLLGFAFGPYTLIIVMMIASGFLGTTLGRLVLGRLRDIHFKTILNAILLLLAARLIWNGISGLLVAS